MARTRYLQIFILADHPLKVWHSPVSWSAASCKYLSSRGLLHCIYGLWEEAWVLSFCQVGRQRQAPKRSWWPYPELFWTILSCRTLHWTLLIMVSTSCWKPISERVMQDSCIMLRPSRYHNAYIRYCGKHPVSWLSKCPVQGQAGVILAMQVTVKTWSSMQCRILPCTYTQSVQVSGKPLKGTMMLTARPINPGRSSKLPPHNLLTQMQRHPGMTYRDVAAWHEKQSHRRKNNSFLTRKS